MANENIEFRVRTRGLEHSDSAGNRNLNGELIASGKCPFCDVISGFRQKGSGSESSVHGDMVATVCDNCGSIVSLDISNRKVFPSPTVGGIEDLPNPIKDYYEEGLRCMGSNAPNGAAALFRKVIEAVCFEYEVSDIDENNTIYSMIESLAEEGHITEDLRESLLVVKDGGNDGVHLNENDPDDESIQHIKGTIDSVLTATVVARQRAEKAREEHPNPHQE